LALPLSPLSNASVDEGSMLLSFCFSIKSEECSRVFPPLPPTTFLSIGFSPYYPSPWGPIPGDSLIFSFPSLSFFFFSSIFRQKRLRFCALRFSINTFRSRSSCFFPSYTAGKSGFFETSPFRHVFFGTQTFARSRFLFPSGTLFTSQPPQQTRTFAPGILLQALPFCVCP